MLTFHIAILTIFAFFAASLSSPLAPTFVCPSHDVSTTTNRLTWALKCVFFVILQDAGDALADSEIIGGDILVCTYIGEDDLTLGLCSYLTVSCSSHSYIFKLLIDPCTSTRRMVN
jgi:hypothetical protein